MAVVSLGGSNELGVEIVGRGTAVTISDHKRRSEDKGRPTGGGGRGRGDSSIMSGRSKGQATPVKEEAKPKPSSSRTT
jgi:hypothetical protein